MSNSDFHAEDHLTIVDGGAYLEVKWRLVWFRSVSPAGVISTEVIEIGPERAVIRATASIVDNGGRIHGSATGFGSETPANFPNYIEAAETKAIGRALGALGFGTQFAGIDFAEGSRLVDAPIRSSDDDTVIHHGPERQPSGNENHATDRQRKLVDILAQQLSLTPQQLDDIAQEAGGAPLASITRKGASALITELQRMKDGMKDGRSEATSQDPDVDEMAVRRWERNLQQATSVATLAKVEEGIESAGLASHPRLAEALNARRNELKPAAF